MEDDFFDSYFDEIDDLYDAPPAEVEKYVSVNDYLRASRNYWMFIPVPEEVCTTEPVDLSTLSDDDLLTMPIHLIVHAMRTSATGGLQVVSPRQIPLAMTAGRTAETRRTEDMYLAGSIASRDTNWPTVDGYEIQPTMAHEPIDAAGSEVSHRAKTNVVKLISAPVPLEDPVLKSFVTARSMVDLQRRPDIDGDAEAIANTFCQMWGTDYEELYATTEASLAPPGELLRYAIGADDVYPMLNAPLHMKVCISVGSSGHDKARYGVGAAVDWRRIRVLAEAVYYIATRLENLSLITLSTGYPPGYIGAPTIRPGILQFRAKPGSVWSYSSETFAVRSDRRDYSVTKRRAEMSERIVADIRGKIGSVCPLAAASVKGVQQSIAPARVIASISPTHEGLIQGYVSIMNRLSTHAGHGRTGGRIVRDILYNYLNVASSAPLTKSVTLIMSILDLSEALGITFRHDMDMVREIAAHLAPACIDIRQKMVSEAARMRTDIYEWWLDLRYMLPDQMKHLAEGSMSWALAASWFMLNPPTAKWYGLTYALSKSSQAALPLQYATSVPLPSKINSADRVQRAAAATLAGLKRRFTSYYSAHADACWLVSRRSIVIADQPKMELLQLAGAMWSIRSRLVSTMSIRWDDIPSDPFMVGGEGEHAYGLTTAPYSSYDWFRRLASSIRWVPPDIAKALPEQVLGRVADVFAPMNKPMIYLDKSCTALRYLTKPSDLHSDMMRTVREMKADLDGVIKYYVDENRTSIVAEPSFSIALDTVDLAVTNRTDDLYSMLSTLDRSDMEYFVGQFESMPEDVQMRLYAQRFSSGEEAAWAITSAAVEVESSVAKETIM